MGLIRRIIAAVLNRLFPPRRRWALLLVSAQDNEAVQEIRRRFPFYLPDWLLRESRLDANGERSLSPLLSAALRMVPVLYAGQHDPAEASRLLRCNPLYWLNPNTNCRESWEWHELLQQHILMTRGCHREPNRDRLRQFLLQSFRLIPCPQP